MWSDGDPPAPEAAGGCYIQNFRLFETRSNFYMIGHDEGRTSWRVLKIGRLEPSELNLAEDATVYTEKEYYELLKRIDEGNRPTGGLKFITTCYGIVGFIKFLGPYYILLITRRRQIGSICGHKIYEITKSKLVSLQNSSGLSDIALSKDENRYKRLLCTIDLTKDFFFSYSYHVMCSVQENLFDGQKGQVIYEKMFVWNEFLTRGIRSCLKSTLWTVPLVYGFFKQAKLSASGKEFKLTLIARRSRYHAGTRYLRRGVNEKGSVANDVETEQIVFKEVPGGSPTYITSIVQNRGSIPLYWSQETSKLNLQPDIILQKKDQNYEATRLHFENLVNRYGNPIIILNLIKTQEKKPRELKLRSEFINAIHFINKDIPKENQLRFLHWDLNRRPRRKATEILELLGKVATYALDLTGFFFSQLAADVDIHDSLRSSVLGNETITPFLGKDHDSNIAEDTATLRRHTFGNDELHSRNSSVKPTLCQSGVLRTNCIDCLDRTNVAQYAYGLAALGQQLFALELIDTPKIDLDAALAEDLMFFYEKMGDTLAVQYTGSAAHNKVFSERRGQLKAAIQSQEFFRTLQRYYSNGYVDAEKQDAINIFLGYFQPQDGRPAIWDLHSDRYCNVGNMPSCIMNETSRSFFQRSLSDGSILDKSTKVISGNAGKSKVVHSVLPDQAGKFKGLSESTPEISTFESDVSYSRYTPFDSSNFLEIDWLSSSDNPYVEETSERSSLVSDPLESLSTENLMNAVNGEIPPHSATSDSDAKETSLLEAELPDNMSEFSKHFFNWVVHGEAFHHRFLVTKEDPT